ncbi:MAG: HepT-like ribonuclease domain-containing protein [Promethearchaeota archaeon]
MVEDDTTRIRHIFDACNEILSFTENLTETQFKTNRMLHLAIVHLLEIIGEAANSLSKKITQKYEEVPWKSIIGMRNRLIHGYFDIDLKIVWQTIQTDVPLLHDEVALIIESENFPST